MPQMPPQFDCYAELELGRTAAPQEITAAYRRLARIHHPDKNPGCEDAATAAFQRIQQAYEILSKPANRLRFDAGPSNSSRQSYQSGGYYEDEDYDCNCPHCQGGGRFYSPGGFPFSFGYSDGYGGHSYEDMDRKFRQWEKEEAEWKAREEKYYQEHIWKILADRRERDEAEAAWKREKAESKQRYEEAQKRQLDRRQKEEREKQEGLWQLLGAVTMDEKLESCLHSDYCAKVPQKKKFKCSACGQKRGLTAFECPYCSVYICQLCVNSSAKKRAMDGAYDKPEEKIPDDETDAAAEQAEQEEPERYQQERELREEEERIAKQQQEERAAARRRAELAMIEKQKEKERQEEQARKQKEAAQKRNQEKKAEKARHRAEQDAQEKAERETREKLQREVRRKAEEEARREEAREKAEREALEKAELEERERARQEQEVAARQKGMHEEQREARIRKARQEEDALREMLRAKESSVRESEERERQLLQMLEQERTFKNGLEGEAQEIRSYLARAEANRLQQESTVQSLNADQHNHSSTPLLNDGTSNIAQQRSETNGHRTNGSASLAPDGHATASQSFPIRRKTSSASPASAATRAFIYLVKSPRAATEPLLRQAMEAYGTVSSITVDERKGIASVEFTDHEALCNVIAASPMPLGEGRIKVMEFRDKKPATSQNGPMTNGQRHYR